jgi:hypothetical protein
MKRLLISLFIIAFIASCKDNPTSSKDSFTMHRIGTWLIDSPVSAKYVGKKAKSNGMAYVSADSDTVIYSQPLNHGLSFEVDTLIDAQPHNTRFIFHYRASTNFNFRPDEIRLKILPYQKYFTVGGLGGIYNADTTSLDTRIDFLCNQPATTTNDLQLKYFYQDTLRQVVIFKADGFSKAMDSFRTCP